VITAHLPAGYLLWRGFPFSGRICLAAALAEAVLPDLDMFYFWLVGRGQVHHHRYWWHAPGFWLAVYLPAALSLRRTRLFPAVSAFMAAIVLHLMLDTIGGGIMWLFPFENSLYRLVEVRATRWHWSVSFLFHWTFLLEVAIWASALWLFMFRRYRREEGSADHELGRRK